MFEFLKQIHEGWRFYSCDWSIEDSCRITLVGTKEDKAKWHKLTEEQQEVIDLYVSGRGRNFNDAFISVLEKCMPLENDYQI